MTGPPDVSVVVATRNRPELLQACVASVLALDHGSFELVIVDQSEVPSVLPLDPRIDYVHSESRGKSAGLNIAIARARGEVLAFTDDDCTVPTDWLSTAEDVLERWPGVEMVFGNLAPMAHDEATMFVPAVVTRTFFTVSSARSAHVRGGAGADLIARRTLFERIGGYDEFIGPGSPARACEEYDLYFRALAAGFTVAFAPEISVLHWGGRPYTDGSGQALKRGYAYGEGTVIAKHLRLGDLRMVGVALHIAFEDLAIIVQSLRHRRLTGIGTSSHKLRGFLRGIITPVDRRRRVFDP